jgi:hypothetical protein
MPQDGARVERGAPRITIDDELGQVAVCEHALFGPLGGQAHEAMEQRQHFARVDGAAQRPLHVSSEALDLVSLRVHRVLDVAARIGSRNE